MKKGGGRPYLYGGGRGGGVEEGRGSALSIWRTGWTPHVISKSKIIEKRQSCGAST